MPQDQIFDPEDLDFDPKSQILQQVKEAKDAKSKKMKVEPKVEEETENEQAHISVKIEENININTIIDNPYLAATKLPSTNNGHG